MKLGMLAIGICILIAASATVMVASAVPEKAVKFDEKTNIVTFMGLEDGDKIGINMNMNKYTYQWQQTFQFNHRNTFSVQVLGNETLIPLNQVDDAVWVNPGEYHATASINGVKTSFEITVEDL